MAVKPGVRALTPPHGTPSIAFTCRSGRNPTPRMVLAPDSVTSAGQAPELAALRAMVDADFHATDSLIRKVREVLDA